MCETFKEKVPTVEAEQYDGTNADSIKEFVGEDYMEVSGDDIVLKPAGKDPRGEKLTVTRGQWVIQSTRGGLSVLNEGEFASRYEIEEGDEPPPLPEVEQAKPLAEDEIQYQPGFGPETEEDKKKREEEQKKSARKEKVVGELKEEKPAPKAYHYKP